MDRFLAKVEKTPTCWLWIAYRDPYSGYGRFGYQRKVKNAHQVAWMLFRGEIPKGMLVLHKCDNRVCVNPDHLFLGTHEDNMADMVAKGRKFRGSCKLRKG